jgi:hypothetical protein
MTPKLTPTGLVVLRTITSSFSDSVCADTEEKPTVTAASTTMNEAKRFFILQTPEKLESKYP